MKRIAFAAALTVVFAVGAVEESVPLTPIQQAALKNASQSVLCGCADCPPTILDDCMCHWARDARDVMTEQAREGETEEQMAAAYIEKHGERYLAAPKKEGFDLLLWILPAVLFAAGTAALLIFFLMMFLKSQKEAAEETAKETAEQPSDEYRERIENELKERGTV